MIRRLRGLKALVHDAVDATTELVWVGHCSASSAVRHATDPVPGLRETVGAIEHARMATTRGVLDTICVVNRMVEGVTDVALDLSVGEPPTTPTPVILRSDAGGAALLGDAALGALNASVGDYLEREDNRLAVEMALRIGDRYVTRADAPGALANAAPRIAIFVHGLATTEWSWFLGAERFYGDPTVSFGTQLHADLGHQPIYVRYNTGVAIEENGAALAALLDAVLTDAPVEQVVLVGHSLGGLVLRSAGHHADAQGLRWPQQVRRVVYLGTPHRGAPLARFGEGVTRIFGQIPHPATRIISRILDNRSQSVKDLQNGAFPTDRLPIPHAQHCFVASTMTADPEHLFGQIFGDLLVPLPSASGSAQGSYHRFGGILHHELQNHPDVYATLHALCAEDAVTPG
ncbi:MAG: alpha/beta fold hydrolase [Myxococcota bacterium]